MPNLKAFLGAVLVLLMSSAGVLAQGLPESVSDPYVAYTEAVQAGDAEAAESAAFEAWQAAEDADIDLETIGILADNYAQVAAVRGNYEQSRDAYRRSVEILEELESDPLLVAETWRLAATSALLAGDNQDAVRCADTAGDLLEEMRQDNQRVQHEIYQARAIQAHAQFRNGRVNASGVRALEALEAFQNSGEDLNSSHWQLAFYSGIYNLLRNDDVESAYWLSAAYAWLGQANPEHPDFEPLYYWSAFARGRIDDAERLELLERLNADGLIVDQPPRNLSIEEADLSNMDAQPIQRTPPRYPQRAANAGLEGTSVHRFDVDENGQPINIETLISIPHPILGEAGEEAISEWVYAPKIVDGQAVIRRGVVTSFEFMLVE